MCLVVRMACMWCTVYGGCLFVHNMHALHTCRRNEQTKAHKSKLHNIIHIESYRLPL